MRVVVTGAAGFIGSNIVKGLNRLGITDIIAVDDLTQGEKFLNMVDLALGDYVDAQDFYAAFAAGKYGKVQAVFHEGACSDTMHSDGRHMLRNNFEMSKSVYTTCTTQGVQLLYASSAAVYGGSSVFIENTSCEKPLNVYGYSKLLFDHWVRQQTEMFGNNAAQVVGFRYFNVYGAREQHKGRMASVVFHHLQQLRQSGQVRLFGAYDGYAAGEQARDFVFVDDVVAVNLWFFQNPAKSGIFNLGTGVAEPFNNVAKAVLGVGSVAEAVQSARLVYIDFPQALTGKYQSYTKADLTHLRTSGCEHQFVDVATGVNLYKQQLSTR